MLTAFYRSVVTVTKNLGSIINGKTMNEKNELLVVGIASSAGGLNPIKELVANAVCHENMAFVLVPHLLREYQSALPKILKAISLLKVKTIEDGMVLERCHLYILPSGFYARVEQNTFRLDPRPPKGINLAANVLFESLAEDLGKNAIGVVLSGAAVGSDGSDGVRAIKEAGGHTYAQEPSSAQYPHMPEAAIATGSIDFVLAPSEIGHELTLVSWASS